MANVKGEHGKRYPGHSMYFPFLGVSVIKSSYIPAVLETYLWCICQEYNRIAF